MTNREFKIELIKQLMERPIFTQKVSDINIVLDARIVVTL